jgi:hypothetical protein
MRSTDGAWESAAPEQRRMDDAELERLRLCGYDLSAVDQITEEWAISPSLKRQIRQIARDAKRMRYQRTRSQQQPGPPRVRARSRERRPSCRRRRATSRSAGGGSSGDEGSSEPPGEEPRRRSRYLAVAPSPRAILTFGCLDAEARGAEVEVIG